jgi:hypothetical protein
MGKSFQSPVQNNLSTYVPEYMNPFESICKMPIDGNVMRESQTDKYDINRQNNDEIHNYLQHLRNPSDIESISDSMYNQESAENYIKKLSHDQLSDNKIQEWLQSNNLDINKDANYRMNGPKLMYNNVISQGQVQEVREDRTDVPQIDRR